MPRDGVNIHSYDALLADAPSDVTLEQLRADLNALGRLRQDARIAFCKRLALAYVKLIGRRLGYDRKEDGGTTKFLQWCAENIKSSSNKQYARRTLVNYLQVGFAADPVKAFESRIHETTTTNESSRKLGVALKKAVAKEEAPRPISITVLRKKYSYTPDIASEVNALMRAWEDASPESRKQFLYLVTDRKGW